MATFGCYTLLFHPFSVLNSTISYSLVTHRLFAKVPKNKYNVLATHLESVVCRMVFWRSHFSGDSQWSIISHIVWNKRKTRSAGLSLLYLSSPPGDPDIVAVARITLKKREELSFFSSVPPQGLEPWTPTLRVSCSTNWAKEAFAIFPIASAKIRHFF